MKLMFVKIRRVNIRNFIPAKNTADFEVFYENAEKSDSFVENLQIDDRVVTKIFRRLIELEEKANYDKETGTVRIVIEEREVLKEKLGRFINEVIIDASRLKSTAPEHYLSIISRIDKKSMVF